MQVVSHLEELLSRQWLTCAQLALLCEAFHLGAVPRAKSFGSYRVELLVALFPRVVDIHCFEVHPLP
jgi:hypothetical protein